MKRFMCSVAALPLLTGAVMASPHGFGSPGYVDNLEILKTYDAYGGASFGNVGPYEVIVGVVHGKLDPNNSANAGIVDIKLAPTDAQGLVEYGEDFVILRPKSADHAKRVLFYDVVNRGNKLALGTFNGALSGTSFDAGQQGNGLLLRQGYTMVWSGWQGDVAQTGQGDTAPVGTDFPVATNPDGSPITGQSREEFIIDNGGGTLSGGIVTAKLSYPAASTSDKSNVTLNWRSTWRTTPFDPLTEGMSFNRPSTAIASSDWSYIDDTHVQFNFPAGADQGSIFEFIYTAKNPTVMGIGFAAVRDFITFLNHDRVDHHGHPNPVNDLKNASCDSGRGRGHIKCDRSENFDVRVMEGISQSGRFTRDFLWRGFNDDGRGPGGGNGRGRGHGHAKHNVARGQGAGNDHTVFNGMFPIIAGSRKTYTDFRWAQPGRWSKQHEDHWQPGDQFPFAYNVIKDPVSGRTDGILKQCLESGTCPKIVQLDGAFEIWGARASLLVTDGAGHPLQVPDNVRLYEVPGTNHGGGSGVAAALSTPSQCVYPRSQVIESTIDRALAPVLVDWVAKGTLPPPSQYPTLQDNTLAPPTDQTAVGFPDLEQAGFPYHGELYNPIVVTDYSNAAPAANLSKPYEVFVGKTDADGNEVAGVRAPEVVVPLATYAGWNVRGPNHSPGDGCISNASTFPLPATHGDAVANNDPRTSLQDRYANKADYVAKVQAAAQQLVQQRLLLPEDVPLYVQQAQSQTLLP